MKIKLKVYVLGNYESSLMRKRIINVLQQKYYYDVIEYSYHDNYILDAKELYLKINENKINNVGFIFCNHGQNIDSMIRSPYGKAKCVLVNRKNCFKRSTYLNANILIFSLNIMGEEEIKKVILFFLNLFENDNDLFYWN